MPALFVVLVLWRVFRRFSYRRTSKYERVPVAIFKRRRRTQALGRALLKHLKSKQEADGELCILAILSSTGQEWPDARQTRARGGRTLSAESFLQYRSITDTVAALPESGNSGKHENSVKAAASFEDILIARPVSAGLAPITAGQQHDGSVPWGGKDTAECAPHFSKRALDLCGALLLGVLMLPVVIVSAVAIWVSSYGPILYKQQRIGKRNRIFTALKFRTMWSNADNKLHEHLEKHPILRDQWEKAYKLKDDPRVTPVGRFLRRFSLDELPQLWNVLIGDMSLIGPRPIVAAEIEKYGTDYAAYESVRPGLTGLWQVSGRSDTTYQQRVAYDSYYVRNWSLGLDTKILIRTVRAVISGVGAY